MEISEKKTTVTVVTLDLDEIEKAVEHLARSSVLEKDGRYLGAHMSITFDNGAYGEEGLQAVTVTFMHQAKE